MKQTLSRAWLAVAILLALAARAYAQGMTPRRVDDTHHDGDGRHDGHDRDRERDHDRRHRVPFVGGPFVYVNPYPAYVTPTPGYWYYCPSAGAYYPYVTYCLDAWVPVPAQ